MNRKSLQIALLAVTLLAPVSAARCSESSERSEVRSAAKAAYTSGDLSSLIRQHSTFSDFLRQRTSSGATKILLFFDGIEEAQRALDGEQLQAEIARTRQWVDAAGEEPLPYILHASALLTYAQRIRGPGYANTVSPQAWKTYSEYVDRATKFLLDNGAVASRSTSWHTWLLNALRSSGARPEVVMSVFEAGVAKSPGDYRLYQFTLHHFLPKWYGDAQAVDAFIQKAVKVAPPEYGEEMYARLYSGAEQNQFGRTMYSESLVDWEQMKAGFVLWNKRFPTSWNTNIFAYHACIAGDKQLTKELLLQIGGAPEWAIWQSKAESTFLSCTKWASDPAAKPLTPRRSPAAENRSASATLSVRGAG